MSMLVAELLELARLDRTSSLDLTETDLAGLVRDAVADAIAVEPGRPVRAETPPRLLAVVDEARIRQVLANLLGNVREHTPADTLAVVRLGEAGGGVLIEVADAGPGMSPEDAARAFDRFHRAGPSAGAPDPYQQWHAGHQDGNGADRVTAPYPVTAGRGPASQASAPLPTGTARFAGRHSHAERDNGAPGGNDPGRARTERVDRTSGSGLGLSIVQAIATAHGGQATLESVRGRGTAVRVWLPVRVVP
jgi:signal transduction histidine kinase